jgi:hypothetical protein
VVVIVVLICGPAPCGCDCCADLSGLGFRFKGDLLDHPDDVCGVSMLMQHGLRWKWGEEAYNPWACMWAATHRAVSQCDQVPETVMHDINARKERFLSNQRSRGSSEVDVWSGCLV